MSKAANKRRDQDRIDKLFIADPDMPKRPNPAAERQQEEKRLREVARVAVQHNSLRRIELLGKKAGKRDQSKIRQRNTRKEISKKGNIS